jgi:hypothetical protein
MPALGDAAKMAGTAMKEFFGNPGVRSALGKTAVTAGNEQLLPRVLGRQPARSVMGSIARGGLEAAIATPVEMRLAAAGVNPGIAGLGGSLIALPIANMVSQAITPEPKHAYQTEYDQLIQAQQLHAFQEQQRYNNEINLALAKNHSTPTEIIHRNPSAELQSVMNFNTQAIPRYV